MKDGRARRGGVAPLSIPSLHVRIALVSAALFPHRPPSPRPLSLCPFSSLDNRYWTMYKLPMFGCTDSSQVLAEIQSAVKSFPKAFIRLVAFDSDKQVQVAGMLVHRPTYEDCCKPEERSV